MREDDEGLIVEADPASILDLPGDVGDTSSAVGAVDRVVAGVSAKSAASMAPQAAIRRVSPGAAARDGLRLLLVAPLALLAVAAALVLARHRRGLARIGRWDSVHPAQRVAAAMARWHWRGRGRGE